MQLGEAEDDEAAEAVGNKNPPSNEKLGNKLNFQAINANRTASRVNIHNNSVADLDVIDVPDLTQHYKKSDHVGT